MPKSIDEEETQCLLASEDVPASTFGEAEEDEEEHNVAEYKDKYSKKIVADGTSSTGACSSSSSSSSKILGNNSDFVRINVDFKPEEKAVRSNLTVSTASDDTLPYSLHPGSCHTDSTPMLSDQIVPIAGW